ncbi:hypothetical protein ACFL6M_01500 [Candidatus Eisenbacteria bacterium]|uniref:Uncharacterized protein n=1 Tax=Eiseniibacteriota bacterium TaxID=2212470 RepID=A0ABV6YIY2_UNCEI
MSTKTAQRIDTALIWLGRRSNREIGLLWIVWVALLVYLLGNGLVLDSYHGMRRERVRLQASEVSLQRLEQLLGRQNEIIIQAEGLMDDYLQAQELETSTLVLQRIDRLRDERTELVSIHSVGEGGKHQTARFRANLTGASGGLARLLFALGDGVPPITLQELSLSIDRGGRGQLSAAALLEVEPKALPGDWQQLFAQWTERGAGKDPTAYEARLGSMPAEQTRTPFPYKAIDRPSVFRTAEAPRRSRRLEAAAPTIGSLIQKLSLLGVIWGDQPVAIIADQSGNQTNYRTVGQFIGELEIIEITRRSVTLRYKDEEGRLE